MLLNFDILGTQLSLSLLCGTRNIFSWIKIILFQPFSIGSVKLIFVSLDFKIEGFTCVHHHFILSTSQLSYFT